MEKQGVGNNIEGRFMGLSSAKTTHAIAAAHLTALTMFIEIDV